MESRPLFIGTCGRDIVSFPTNAAKSSDSFSSFVNALLRLGPTRETDMRVPLCV